MERREGKEVKRNNTGYRKGEIEKTREQRREEEREQQRDESR